MLFNLLNCNRIQSIIMMSPYYGKFLNKRILLSTLTNKISCNLIDIHPNVSTALNTNKPIVALESTVITHGMPYPENLQTALDCEDIIRKEGAIPATIAIIDGRIKIGLTKDQFERLSTIDQDNSTTTGSGGTVIKCSRRDLAYVTSKKLCGGTTVAGTMIIAKMVGIKVFSTGGIGGVHRNGHETFDISADLIELGKTSIAVISAGIKSILDIPKTLEYLETQGVCVVTYQSENGYFPAFYSRSSSLKASYNFQNSSDIAKMIYSSLKLNLNSGILIGAPIPNEYAIEDSIINDAIENALIKAKEQNITGKSVTPFLLDVVSKLTKGDSLKANIALLKNNAKVASKISIQLSKLYNDADNDDKTHHFTVSHKTNDSENLKKIEKCSESIVNSESSVNSDKSVNSEKSKNSKSSRNNNVPVIIGASILDITIKIEEDDLKVSGKTFIHIFFLP